MMKLFRILVCITAPIFLIMLFASLLTTKQYLLLSKGMYESHEDISYDHDYAADRIMGYLNYRYDSLEVDYNNGEGIPFLMLPIEIKHMEDVKDVYTMLRVVALVSFVISVPLLYYMYKKDKKELYKTFKALPLGPIVFIVIVGGYIAIDFGGAFSLFHRLFFPQGDWLIPWHVLIPLLPEMFWMVSGVIILVLFSLSLGLIYYLNEKYLRNA